MKTKTKKPRIQKPIKVFTTRFFAFQKLYYKNLKTNTHTIDA